MILFICFFKQGFQQVAPRLPRTDCATFHSRGRLTAPRVAKLPPPPVFFPGRAPLPVSLYPPDRVGVSTRLPLAFFFLWAGHQRCLSVQQNLAAPACPASRWGSHLAMTRVDCAEGKIWSPVGGLNLCHGTPRTLEIRTFMCIQLGWGAPFHLPGVRRDRPMPKTTAQAPALLTSCNNQDLKTCH